MEYIDFHTHRPTAEGVISPRSFGIHPWDAGKIEASTCEEFTVEYLERFAEVQIVGECGLDKVCGVDWQRQTRVLEWQIAIAERLRKPMVIHCVRAFNELIAIRERHPEGVWVVHGFGGTMQLADQLRRQNIFVSFGAALLDPRRMKVRETLRGIPYPFLLETDTSELGIEEVYRAAAAIRGVSEEEMADTIKESYMTLMKMI